MVGGLAIACLLGCGEAGSSISGLVTLDGTRLDEATISLVPLEAPNQSAAWTTVAQGQYAISAADGLQPGNYRVEIRAVRASNKANPNDPTLMDAKEAVPSRYNSQSQLVTELKAGVNKADFELKSK
jgi:hypothetical protein